MDIKNIKAFYEVVRCGSCFEAGQTLGFSEAGIRRQIKVLEQEVGHPLFTTVQQRLVLTKYGDVFYKFAEEFVALAIGVDQAMRAEARHLKIMTSSSIAGLYMGNIIESIREKSDIKVVSVMSQDITPALFRNDTDICIWTEVDVPSHFHKRLIAHFNYRLYASQSYIDRKGLAFTEDDLCQHDIIAYEEDTRKPYDDINWHMKLGEERFEPILTTNSGILMLEAVDEGLGIGSLSDQGARLLKNPHRTILPDVEGPHQPVYMYYNSLYMTPRDATFYQDIICQYLR